MTGEMKYAIYEMGYRGECGCGGMRSGGAGVGEVGFGVG